MSTSTLYGEGGYDPDKPDGNVASTVAFEPPAEQVTAEVLRVRLDQALDHLRAFIQSTKPSTASAQASAAYDAAKLCARVCLGLVKLHLRRLDSAD